MQELSLTTEQRQLVEAPVGGTTFLEGLAGTGKTTAAVERLKRLLGLGIPAATILVLVPQRLLARPYLQALRSGETPPGGQTTIISLGGLARRMVELYWPLISESAGFAQPNLPPTFLGLETAQYFMAEVVRPYLEQGFFGNVTLQRHRLYSQILDWRASAPPADLDLVDAPLQNLILHRQACLDDTYLSSQVVFPLEIAPILRPCRVYNELLILIPRQ